MNARTICYWLATALTAFVYLSGGIADIVQPTAVKEGMDLLGYPAYFATILGIWKVLGGAVVLAPRLPLIKEWAYAGMLFNLTGAAASHAAVGDPLAKIITPLVILLIVATSWALRPSTRTLPGVIPYSTPLAA